MFMQNKHVKIDSACFANIVRKFAYAVFAFKRIRQMLKTTSHVMDEEMKISTRCELCRMGIPENLGISFQIREKMAINALIM